LLLVAAGIVVIRLVLRLHVVVPRRRRRHRR
jgi:hypothetical protein